MLTFENVSRVFPGPQGEVTALRQVSMAAAPGELVAVRGPSGCGKSTLLLVAGGLLRPTAGEVCWHAEPIYRLSPGKRAAWRARQVGFVFQQFHLVPYLTVRENILLPSVAWPMPGAAARTDELLRRFGLADRARHLPAQLSIGECQRTAMARALFRRPALLLADEPTGNLDPDNAEAVFATLAECARDGAAVILVTHDPRAARVGTRSLDMQEGALADGCV